MKDVRMNPEKNNKNIYSWHKQIYTEYTTVGCNNKHIYIIQEGDVEKRKNFKEKYQFKKVLLQEIS